ncbi:MAG: hypothetical protein SFU55_11285 [Methylophilus sp.]|nr:hypothetical protein [Methylophilus sp.]
MKNMIMASAIAVLVSAMPVLAADVGVSISVGQPGFYGRIDIGDYPYPQPRVIYRQPRIIERVYVEREPIYMRVPPGHAKKWAKFCHRYDACGVPVYFVQDSWYEHEYVPYYHEYHGHRRDERWEDRGESASDQRERGGDYRKGHRSDDHENRGNEDFGNGHDMRREPREGR